MEPLEIALHRTEVLYNPGRVPGRETPPLLPDLKKHRMIIKKGDKNDEEHGVEAEPRIAGVRRTIQRTARDVIGNIPSSGSNPSGPMQHYM